MAILRSVGARPAHVFRLLCIESFLLTIGGIIAGLILHYVLTGIGSIILKKEFGLSIQLSLPQQTELIILCSIAIAGLVAGTFPAIQAYRKSLADGLSQTY